MSSKPFSDVLNVFEPLLQNEILSFTNMLNSAYSMKTRDVETRFQDEMCQLGDEALRTRTKMDDITKSAMKEVEKVTKSKIEDLGGKEAKLLQEYMTSKNCITQEMHGHALETLASFRTFLAKTSETPTQAPSFLAVKQLVDLLKPLTPPDARIQYLENFMSTVLTSPFKLTIDNISTVINVVMQSIQGKNRYAEALFAVHDDSATSYSFIHDSNPSSNWILSEFELQPGQPGAGQLSNRQALGRFSYDLTSNIQFTVIMALTLWYGETYGRPFPVKSMASFSVDSLESIVRDDFGLLGLSRVGQDSLRFYLPRGEGIKGYADLGCELLFSNDLKLYSMQFGNDPVITEGFTALHVLRALSNIVCGVGVYMHFSQIHHRFNDDLLYAFYAMKEASDHPLRCLLDPLGIGSANKNDTAILSGYQDFETLFGNFTMQTRTANIRLHTEIKNRTCTPISWPDFVGQTFPDADPEKVCLVSDLWIWYNAFNEFVGTALHVLDITSVDKIITGWLGNGTDMNMLRRTLVEAYFNNVIHELAGSLRVLQMLQNSELCTATRYSASVDFATALPSCMQHVGATILFQATLGSTIRFDSVRNHPWSHIPKLGDVVQRFQSEISKIPLSSLVHPSKVETSIAW
jgi:hypothetical protein